MLTLDVRETDVVVTNYFAQAFDVGRAIDVGQAIDVAWVIDVAWIRELEMSAVWKKYLNQKTDAVKIKSYAATHQSPSFVVYTFPVGQDIPTAMMHNLFLFGINEQMKLSLMHPWNHAWCYNFSIASNSATGLITSYRHI